jgi:maleate isomerase
MTSRTYRVGQIVPSSNVTMETEIPAMLWARQGLLPNERFTFHSSRMRMKKVTKEELAAMDAESDRCALELSDARVDVLGYACLVAIMNMGPGYHRTSAKRLHAVTVKNGSPAPVVTSAGALIDGLQALGAKKISIICPYLKPLTKVVVDYIEHEGITVKDYVALEIPDNNEVAAQDPANLLGIAKRLDLKGIDVLVASACVQMPSLSAIPQLERALGIPVVSAATCTAHQLLKSLGLKTSAPKAGELLSGRRGAGNGEKAVAQRLGRRAR